MEKKYIEIEKGSDGENVLQISVDYSLGGYNWYNGDQERRGYYLYCTPCEIRENEFRGASYKSVTQVLGKGLKILLKEVSRRSKKAEEEAIKIAEEKEDFVISKVCERYGLKLKGATL